MSNLEMWNLIVGFISSGFVIPIIQRPDWSKLARSGVTFAYSCVAAVGTVWFTPADGNVRNYVSSVLMVFVAAIASYKGLWRNGPAPAIEDATSPRTSLRRAA